MKKFEELEFEERKEITLLFANWLKSYTHDVIIEIMEKRDEIINNEFTMNMLRELKEREDKEKIDFEHNIGNLLGDFETFKEYNAHNNPITHSSSYRNVLHDMYFS